MAKLRLRKGDMVKVIAGKDKGKKGKILYALPQRERVVVEGINRVKKHQRPTPQNPQTGGIIEIEAPIHVSNVQIICPNCGQSTRIGNRRTEEGKRIRVCKKCGKDIDK